MSPIPQFERQPDTLEDHEKSAWPWDGMFEKPTEKEEKKTKESKKEKEPQPKAEKQEKLVEKKAEKPKEEHDRKEKRTDLVEQALALVAKHEEEPIPRDPNALARVMIAHHVVHLHEQLQHPEQLPKNLSVKEIEASLDYIVQLDAKLADPSIEVSPDVEASYQEIIEFAEATLREGPDLEVVVANSRLQQDSEAVLDGGDDIPTSGIGSPSTTNTTSPLSPQIKPNNTTTRKPADASDNELDRRSHAVATSLAPVAAAAALFHAITNLGRRKTPLAEVSTASGDGLGTTVDSLAPVDVASNNPNAPASSGRREATTPSAMARQEQTTAPARREFSPIPPRRSPVLAATAVATTLAATHAGRERTPEQSAYTAPLNETFQQHPHREAIPESAATPDRKIEHMPLLQLLDMAEGVALGHGRYLRREFEAGTIDREGLVKILKAQSKGRDYQWEFRQQSTRFTTLKNTSPEFLHTTKPANNDPIDTTPVTAEEATSPTAESTLKEKEKTSPAQPISLAPPKGNHPLLPKFASSTLPKPPTTQRVLLITAALVGGLTIVSLLAMAIFAWLG